MIERPAAIRDAYDEWHRRHATGSGPWYTMVSTFIDARGLVQDKRILEIGCGSGDFAFGLGARGAHSVVGEDLSSVAIARATEGPRADNVTFAVGDIQQIAHPSASFDLVISCETIEHVPNPRRAVAELARVLAPGGWLVLTSPNYLGLIGAHRAYRRLTRRGWDEGGQPHVNWTMLPRSAKWVKDAGLKIAALDGVLFSLPVRGRPGGLPLHPSPRVHRWIKYFAQHVMIGARKP
jgi:2-polyprenyl-3-methyl-5-hydroxy-6-metoxy-1,4-benzoquinol methylase